MNGNTIKVIYNAFKNCLEYFEKMASFDEEECKFQQILKKIKTFFSRKQLFESSQDGKVYDSKKKVEFVFDYLEPVSFTELCLMAVICNCKIHAKVCFDNHFATNELVLSLVNKAAAYYGFDDLITLSKEEKDVNAMCDKGRILILRKSRKYSRLNQKDLLVLIDGKDKK